LDGSLLIGQLKMTLDFSALPNQRLTSVSGGTFQKGFIQRNSMEKTTRKIRLKIKKSYHFGCWVSFDPRAL
jgi:hypothetical protein